MARGVSALAALATAAALQRWEDPLDPFVSVEFGGVAVYPCAHANTTTECILKASGGSVFAMHAFVDGLDHTGTAKKWNDTHCACYLPPADAESPVDVYFSAAVKGKNFETNIQVKAGSLNYEAIWTSSFTLRPYLSTNAKGGLIVQTHAMICDAEAKPNMSMFYDAAKSGAAENKVYLLRNATVPGRGAKSVVEFEFGTQFPAEVQMLPIQTVFSFSDVAAGGSVVFASRTHYLSRVRAPEANYTGSFVQVDYTRKTLAVVQYPLKKEHGELVEKAASPLLGVGYYDSQTLSKANMTRQAAAGLTWGMRYLISNDPTSKEPRKSDAWIRNYLDWSAASDMGVMLDLFRFVEQLVKEPATLNATWQNLTRQIEQFRSHPALIGYYVCDDCTTQFLEAYEVNKKKHPELPGLEDIYLHLKKLDPYHPLIGAEEAGNAYTFTTNNARVPGISLDLVMVENYVDSLEQNARLGNADSPGMDGTFAGWPLTHEPIVNCPGIWLVASSKAYESDRQKAEVMYSMSWLSAVMANLPLQLNFRLFPFISSRIDLYEYLLKHGVGRYSTFVNEIAKPYILAPPSGLVEPKIQVKSFSKSYGEKVYAADEFTKENGYCAQCARIWRKPSPHSPVTDHFCALMAVVNVLNTTATSVKIEMKQAAEWGKQAEYARFRRVDGGDPYHGETIHFTSNILRINELKPYETRVYVADHRACEDRHVASSYPREAEMTEQVWI